MSESAGGTLTNTILLTRSGQLARGPQTQEQQGCPAARRCIGEGPGAMGQKGSRLLDGG